MQHPQQSSNPSPQHEEEGDITDVLTSRTGAFVIEVVDFATQASIFARVWSTRVVNTLAMFPSVSLLTNAPEIIDCIKKEFPD